MANTAIVGPDTESRGLFRVPLLDDATTTTSDLVPHRGDPLSFRGDTSLLDLDTPLETGPLPFHIILDEVHGDRTHVATRAWPLRSYAPMPMNVLVYRRELLSATEIARSRVLATLASVAADLRRHIDLPVQDVAKMCGIGRRQFYNLLDGSTKIPQEEQHIRLVHELVVDLHRHLAHDARAVRAAVLTPLEEIGYESFFDAAVRRDADVLIKVQEALLARLARAERLPDRLAPSAMLPGDAATWDQAEDFLRGYAKEPSASGRE